MTAAAAAIGPRRPTRPAGGLHGPGSRELLVTVDRTARTAARLGVASVADTPVAVDERTDLLTLNPLTLTERAWADFTAALSVFGGRAPVLPVLHTLTGIAGGELSGLPGIEEFLLLREIRDAAASGRWRRVVVDCSGFGDPYALLRAPSVLSQTIDRLWPAHRRLASASERPALAGVTAAVQEIDRDCRDIAELLVDGHAVAAHLVLPGGERGCDVLAGQLAVIALMGLPLRSIVVNEGSGGPAGPVAAEVATRLDPARVSMITQAAMTGPLDRIGRIRALGAVLPDPSGRPWGSAAAELTACGGTGLDAVYELSWRQPLPDPDGLMLGRSVDDLLVTVDGFRHPVRLPSVLRRCTVADADWDRERLRVRFRPDPAVWPQRD